MKLARGSATLWRAARRGLVAELWTGEQPLAGWIILLHAEQGFGDTLQFCRYVPVVAARGARVVLEVPPALLRLLARLEGVTQVVAEGDAPPAFDLHCPLMSLPLAFATTPGPVPYLTADRAPVAVWRDTLAGLPGRRVGLVWAGHSRDLQPHAVALDRQRSVRLADMAPLASVPGCSFVWLQLGPPATERAAGGAGGAGCCPVVARFCRHRGAGGEPGPSDRGGHRGYAFGWRAGHTGLVTEPVRHVLAVVVGARRQPLVSESTPVPPGGAGGHWTEVMERVAVALEQFVTRLP